MRHVALRREATRPEEPIFVNREGPLAVILDAAKNIPANHAIVRVFHGAGGEGKTALLRKARQELRKDERLIVATLDFQARTILDPAALAVRLRNLFKQEGVKAGVPGVDIAFAAFDLALVLAWNLARPEAPLPRLVQSAIVKSEDATAEYLEEGFNALVEGIPFIGKILGKAGGWAVRRGLNQYLYQRKEWLRDFLARADAEEASAEQLLDELPSLLAQDLSHWLKSHPKKRFVLLVDEYEEVLRGAVQAGAPFAENRVDRGLRDFILDCEGLLTVFFMRGALEWDQPEELAQALEGNSHALAGLKDEDARDWLRQAGITDAALQAAMLDGARESDAQGALVFPLLLNLQIEHYHAILGKGRTPQARDFTPARGDFKRRLESMANRLLDDYRDEPALQKALRRLALARRFTRRVFEVATKGLMLDDDAFDRISRMPFMQAGEADGEFVMHRALAEALRALMPEEERRETALALFTFFSSQGSVESFRELTDEHAQAIMQAARLAADAGVDIGPWLEETHADNLLHAGRLAELAELWRMAVAQFRERGEDRNLSVALNKLGDIALMRGEVEEAQRLFAESLDIARALAAELGTPESRRDLSVSLERLGDIALMRGELDEAQKLFAESLDIRRALAAELGTPESRRDLSISLNKLGDIALMRGELEEAQRLFAESLDIRRALAAEVGTPQSRRDLSVSLNKLGDIALMRGDLEEAQKLFAESLDIDRALAAELGTPESRRDLSVSLNKLGDIALMRGEVEEAQRLFAESLDIARALAAEVGTPQSRRDLSVSLNKLGDIALMRGDLEEAQGLFAEDLDIARALAAEVGTPESRRDLSVSLDRLGDIARMRGKLEEAQGLFAESLDIRRALAAEVGTPQSRRDLSVSLSKLGDIALMRGEVEEAQRLFAESLDIARVLAAELGTPESRRALSVSLSKLGDIALMRGEVEEAQRLFAESLDIDRALAAEVGTPGSRRDLSISLDRLGDIALMRGEVEEAQGLFAEGLDIRRALAAELGTPESRRDLSVSLNKLGDIALMRGEVEEAQGLFAESLDIRRALVAEVGTPESWRDLAVSHARMALLARARAAGEEEKAHWQEALRAAQRYQEMMPTPDAEELLTNIRRELEKAAP
jgi:tetratricopeptide (TPR) repeat protein